MLLQKKQNKEAIIEKLLHYGAEVNYVAELEPMFYFDLMGENGYVEGATNALMIAAENGNQSCVKLLLAHGADPKFGSPITGTPLDMAEEYKKKTVAKYLREL